MKIEKVIKLLQETAEYEKLNSAEELYKTVKKLKMIGPKNAKDEPKFLTEIEDILLKALIDNPQHPNSLLELTTTQLQIGKTALPDKPSLAMEKANSILGRDVLPDKQADAYLIKAQAAAQLKDQKTQFESLLSATQLMKEPPLDLLVLQASLIKLHEESTPPSPAAHIISKDIFKAVNEMLITGYERALETKKLTEFQHLEASRAYRALGKKEQSFAAIAHALATHPASALARNQMESALCDLPNHQSLHDSTQVKHAAEIEQLKKTHAEAKESSAKMVSQQLIEKKQLSSRFKSLTFLLTATTLLGGVFTSLTYERKNAVEKVANEQTANAETLTQKLQQQTELAHVERETAEQKLNKQIKDDQLALNTAVNSANTKYLSLEQEKNLLLERIEKINADPEKVSRTEYEFMKTECTKYKQAGDDLQKKYDALAAAKTALETDLATKIASITTLTASEKEKADQITALDKKITSDTESRTAEKEKLIAEYNTKIQEKEAIKLQLDQAQKEINQYKSNTRVSVLEKEIDETKAHLEEITKTRDELEIKIEGLIKIAYLDKAYDKTTQILDESSIQNALQWAQTADVFERIATAYSLHFKDTHTMNSHAAALTYFKKATETDTGVKTNISLAIYAAESNDFTIAVDAIIKGLQKKNNADMLEFETRFILENSSSLTQDQKNLLERAYKNAEKP